MVLFSSPHPNPGVAHSSPLRLRGAQRVPSLTSEQPGPQNQSPDTLGRKLPLKQANIQGRRMKLQVSSKTHSTELHGARLKGTFRYGPYKPAPSTPSHLGCLAGEGRRTAGREWRKRTLPPGTALRARARISFPKWLRLGAQLYRAQPRFGPASPAALRSARRRTGTPAHIPRPSRARLPLPRPLRHPTGTLAPRARPSASRRPHTHPLRGARWEPLAEAKGTAADPRRQGSDARCKKLARRRRGLRVPGNQPARCRRPHLPTCARLTCLRVLAPFADAHSDLWQRGEGSAVLAGLKI